jgi:hypothetical protein
VRSTSRRVYPSKAVRARLESLAARNSAAQQLSFLGAGAYGHFVPSVVDNILQRAEFYSAYTPYQPEVSQGTLQAIFEFQTLVAMLFDLEVANASMYDGASATAEAVLMALRIQPKRRGSSWRARCTPSTARSSPPTSRAPRTSSCRGAVRRDGTRRPRALAELVDARTAAVVLGYPNFFGVIEDLRAAQPDAPHGAVLITATAEPLALALVQPPGALGAEIAVGEGQSLGVPLSTAAPASGCSHTRCSTCATCRARWSAKRTMRRAARLRADARDARAAHPPRAGDLEHLHQPRTHRAGGHRLPEPARPAGTAPAGAHQLESRPSRRRRAVRSRAGRARSAGRSSTSSPCAGARAQRRWSEPSGGVLAGVPLGTWYPELEDAVLIAVTELHGDDASTLGGGAAG